MSAEFSRGLYHLSKGVDSLSREEHGRFFDLVQRLGLSNEVKLASVSLYLDFKNRPIGEYNQEHENLDIFLVASVSLAAKAIGDFRTDQEFESKLFVNKQRLFDAEERILRSFGVQYSVVSLSELISRLTRRQIETMADHFEERGLLSIDERELLVKLSFDSLEKAVAKGLSPKMSYRGRASGVMLKNVKDLGLRIGESDIARAAGFDKKGVTVNAKLVEDILKETKN